MKIFFADSALSDLQEIIQYYEDQLTSHVGEKFVSDIIDRIETLLDHPDIGRVVQEFESQNIREIIHPPFRIVYLREKSKIHIARVWRSERLLVLSEDRE
ncbi:MAG: type II toxin-antitoxin system RelE/ParE family toxin [Gammaproteobacteria bacterium]|nr:MAG: type II toxin-antitoxin system RelE/ParE family toxin [Gammaproteobacteria bacterium]